MSNSLDFGQCGDLKTLKVTGSGVIAAWGLDANHINVFDASGATGNVTFGIENLTTQTVIGGSGRDMISFDSQAANVSKANWSGIEDILMRKGGVIDAAGITGLRELWNLSNGEIRNLTWTSAERGVGEQYFSTLDSNATGDFHLNVGHKDILAENSGDGQHFSSYTLPELLGNISVNIANATPGGAGMHIDAPKAKALQISATGTLYLGGDTNLSSVEDLTLELKADSTAEAGIGSCSISDHHQSNQSLESVKTITVTAADMRVDLGNIGSQSDGVTINVNDSALFRATSVSSAGSISINASTSAGAIQIEDMQATGNISFIGSNAETETENGATYSDELTVKYLGNNSISDFDLGGGNDILFIHLDEDRGAEDMATVNVRLGAGTDFVGARAGSGLLRINVHDYASDNEMSVVQGGLQLDKTTALDYFTRFGMDLTEDDINIFDVTLAANDTPVNLVEYNSNVYIFDPAATGGLTMTVLEGWTAEDAADIHLR